MKHLILQYSDRRDLEREIDSKTANGWILSGGLQVVSSREGLQYIQLIIKVK